MFLTLGEVIPPARFPEGKIERKAPAPGERLGIERIESASGGPFPVGIHDTRWDRTCTPDGDLGCWPEHARTGEYFADALCRAALTSWGPCANPVLVRHANHRAARIGAAHAGEVWWAPKKMCPPAPTPPLRPVFSVGEAFEPDAIAALACKPHGTGALRLRALTSAPGTVFDHQACNGLGWSYQDGTGITCWPRRTPGGTIRCLPHEPRQPFFYGDAACTRMLVPCGAHCEQGVLFHGYGFDVVPGAAELRALTARFAGPEVYVVSSPGKCEPLPLANSFMMWEVGATLPWDRYPALAEWRGRERLGK